MVTVGVTSYFYFLDNDHYISVTPANSLHLNITDNDNSLDYDLAIEVIDFFRLSISQALKIKGEVLASVSRWKKLATNLKISRQEQQLMESAFRV